MISWGVLAGTKNADDEETSTPATPASAMVGTSGATDSRLAVVDRERALLALTYKRQALTT